MNLCSSRPWPGEGRRRELAGAGGCYTRPVSVSLTDVDGGVTGVTLFVLAPRRA